MKFFIIDTYYEDFLNDFYSKNPEIKKASYEKQKELLLAEQFGTADFYSKNLKKIGHQAEEFIINNEILQKQWAKENNIKYPKSHFQRIPKIRNYFKNNRMAKILEFQILEFKPDIIYVQNLGILRPAFLEKIKKYTKLLVGQIACPLPPSYFLKPYDLIISSFPHYVKRFRNKGIKSEYLKIGFEESILDKLKESNKKYNAVFVGGISKHHNKIIETFEYLVKNNIPVDFWGYGFKNRFLGSSIHDKYHGEAWALDMYNIFYNAKISINRHIDVAENYANNLRLYESTGVGTMLITDYKDNLNELFELGREIETYKSKEELLEKINYYFNHEEERKKIAKAGQERTLREHTYFCRMQELVEIINQYL